VKIKEDPQNPKKLVIEMEIAVHTRRYVNKNLLVRIL